MTNKLKIDLKKVDYDGHSFRLVIEDEEVLVRKLKEKQSEIIKDLEKQNRIEQLEKENLALEELNDLSEIRKRVIDEVGLKELLNIKDDE